MSKSIFSIWLNRGLTLPTFLYHQYIISDSLWLLILQIVQFYSTNDANSLFRHTDARNRRRKETMGETSIATFTKRINSGWNWSATVCFCICSSLVSLYYKLGIQKVPPRVLVPRIRSSRCIYWRTITIRFNLSLQKKPNYPFYISSKYSSKEYLNYTITRLPKMSRNFA